MNTDITAASNRISGVERDEVLAFSGKRPGSVCSLQVDPTRSLNQRVMIQRFMLVQGEQGTRKKVWTNLVEVSANLSPFNMQDVPIAGDMVADTTHLISVRHHRLFDDPHQVTQLRVHFENRLFEIQLALREPKAKDLVTLLVTELAESWQGPSRNS